MGTLIKPLAFLCLHTTISLVYALADAEVEIFLLLAIKTQRVKLQLFFVYTSVASKKGSV